MNKRTIYWLVGIGLTAAAVGTVIYLYHRNKNGSKSGSGLGRNREKNSNDKQLARSNRWFSQDLQWYQDPETRGEVERLHPAVRHKFKELLSRIEKELGLIVNITSGYRTWSEQEKLHKKNSKNAAAGYSSHNYGFGLDINVKDKNGNIILVKASPKSKWKNSGIVDMAKRMGFGWGGDFSDYYDPIHFSVDPTTREELRKRYIAGNTDESGYVILNENEQSQLAA